MEVIYDENPEEKDELKIFHWAHKPKGTDFIDENTGFRCMITKRLGSCTLYGHVIIPPHFRDIIEECKVSGIEELKVGNANIIFEFHPVSNECKVGFEYNYHCYAYDQPNLLTLKEINCVKQDCRKLAKHLHDLLVKG